MSRQLPFSLDLPADMGRDAFFVAPGNATALGAIAPDRDWPNGRLVLAGSAGSGKTHLLHIWAREAGARHLDGATLCDPASLTGHEDIAIDHADAVANNPAREEALFHILNQQAANGGRVLMVARRAPARWGVGLADLASRLTACTTVALEPPDDQLLGAVLLKHFTDRQIAVAPNLIPYLVARMERSLAEAERLVARLDADALAQGRPITRALAAEVMDTMSETDIDTLGTDNRPST